MKGRKPKPKAIKQLAGNPGKRPIPDSAPEPNADHVPIPPHLDEEERIEWVQWAPMLMRLGLLSEADAFALSMLVAKVVRYKRARAAWNANGGEDIYISDKGNPSYHPLYGVVKGYEESILKMLTEFGLTPSSRARVDALAREDSRSLAEMLFEDVDADAVSAPGDLEELVGKKQAGVLSKIGLNTIERAAYAAQEGIRLDKYKGIGPATVRKLKEI